MDGEAGGGVRSRTLGGWGGWGRLGKVGEVKAGRVHPSAPIGQKD